MWLLDYAYWDPIFLDKLKGETDKRLIYLPYKSFWMKMNDNDIETFREIQASVLGVPRG